MISGALFLRKEREITTKGMLKKYVPRILVILLFWGFFYNFVSNVIIGHGVSLSIFLKSLRMVFAADTSFCYQFWYLYMLVGLYLCLPLIKPWTDKYMTGETPGKECYLTFGIFALLSVGISTVKGIFEIEDTVWKGAFTVFWIYLFYALCGQFIWRWGLPKILRRIAVLIFGAHVAGFACGIATGHYDIVEKWYGYGSLFTFAMAILIFDAARRIPFDRIPKGLRRAAASLSRYSFGIYILHVIVLTVFGKVGITGFLNDITNIWLSPIIQTAMTLGVCWLITYVVRKIPVAKHLV